MLNSIDSPNRHPNRVSSRQYPGVGPVPPSRSRPMVEIELSHSMRCGRFTSDRTWNWYFGALYPKPIAETSWLGYSGVTRMWSTPAPGLIFHRLVTFQFANSSPPKL